MINLPDTYHPLRPLDAREYLRQKREREQHEFYGRIILALAFLPVSLIVGLLVLS